MSEGHAAAEAFLAEHAGALAHNLAADCWRAATELHASLGERGAWPAGIEPVRVFHVLLSFRATLELMAVEQRFGTPAHDLLLAAMREEYGRNVLQRGDFVAWVAAAHETMRRSEDPGAWLRIHAEQVLGTCSPEHDVFHAALGWGLRVGASVANVVGGNVAGAV